VTQKKFIKEERDAWMIAGSFWASFPPEQLGAQSKRRTGKSAGRNEGPHQRRSLPPAC